MRATGLAGSSHRLLRRRQTKASGRGDSDYPVVEGRTCIGPVSSTGKTGYPTRHKDQTDIAITGAHRAATARRQTFRCPRAADPKGPVSCFNRPAGEVADLDLTQDHRRGVDYDCLAAAMPGGKRVEALFESGGCNPVRNGAGFHWRLRTHLPSADARQVSKGASSAVQLHRLLHGLRDDAGA